jgi:hypothetical protein
MLITSEDRLQRGLPPVMKASSGPARDASPEEDDHASGISASSDPGDDW